MTVDFENWLNIDPDKFYDLPWEYQWGTYQRYFWDLNKWVISIYPYTDKIGGRIDTFWDEGIINIGFITNNPVDAQERIVEEAFKLLETLN